MKKYILLFTYLLPSLQFISTPILAAPLPATGTVEVFFSPKGGCTKAIVREIGSAKSEILVQAYSFTSVSIAKALIEAKKRGLKIEAVLDKLQTGLHENVWWIVNGLKILLPN